MLDLIDDGTDVETPDSRLFARLRHLKPGGAAPTKEAGQELDSKVGGGSRPRLHLPGGRTTTANAGVLYPGMGSSVFGVDGVYLGTDMLTCDAAFHFELIQAKLAGTIDNTNMMVFGKPGKGKSALIKTFLLRVLGAYGPIRYPVIVDVKGEYRVLAENTDMQVIKLSPGGTLRLNPLGRRGPGETAPELAQRRQRLLSAIAGSLVARSLTVEEKAGLYYALLALGNVEEAQQSQATLRDLVQVLVKPPNAVSDNLADFDGTMSQVNVALRAMLDGYLQGLFDGNTSVDIDPSRNRGLVIDVSELAGAEELLPVVLVAVVGWLYEVMRADWGPVKKLQCFDEAWLLFRNPEVVKFLQETWKLGRSYGFGNIAVLHRPSDLWSGGAEGSAVVNQLRGLLIDTAVVVSYAQSPDELDQFGGLVGWSDAEKRRIVGLHKGQSLWVIGDQERAVLNHTLGEDLERAIVETDRSLQTTTV